MTKTPESVLEDYLAARVPDAARQWLSDACEKTSAGGAARHFPMAFGLVTRRVGKGALEPSDAERQVAAAARPGWEPRRWTIADVARARLLLALPSSDAGSLVKVLDALAADADLGELVALYRSLPLLPHPEAHRARAAEGVRTNMQDVFEAVALDNPYPSEQLDDLAFNQMVVKALFLGVPLYDVRGLDARRNAALCRMLVDYAAERRAARRTVSPELWRPVVPFAADPAAREALRRTWTEGSEAERQAVARCALGLRDTPEADPATLAAIDALEAKHPETFARVRDARPSWPDLVRGKVVS